MIPQFALASNSKQIAYQSFGKVPWAIQLPRFLQYKFPIYTHKKGNERKTTNHLSKNALEDEPGSKNKMKLFSAPAQIIE